MPISNGHRLAPSDAADRTGPVGGVLDAEQGRWTRLGISANAADAACAASGSG